MSTHDLERPNGAPIRIMKVGSALATLILLASCVEWFPPELQPPPVPGPLGNAVAQNQAVQVVNPNPPDYQQPPDLVGVRAAIAINRYNSNAVRSTSTEGTQ